MTTQMTLGRSGSSRLHASQGRGQMPGRSRLDAVNLGSMVPGRGLRSVGWLVLIGLCFALLMVLAFRVNALKSEVRLAENRIVSLKREKLYLETEFETRASQQQLKAWNDVEFGYIAPGSTQYLENERQLASLGKVPGPDAPRPIRVASADDAVVAAAAFPQMVSPLSGALLGKEAADAEEVATKPVDRAEAAASLGERLGKVERVSAADSDESAPANSASAGSALGSKVAKAKAKPDVVVRKLAVSRKQDSGSAKAGSDARKKPVAEKAPTQKTAAQKTAERKDTKAPGNAAASPVKAAQKSPAKTSAKPDVKSAAKAKAKPAPQGGSGGTKKEVRR